MYTKLEHILSDTKSKTLKQRFDEMYH